MQRFNLMLELLCIGWAVVEANPAQQYGYRLPNYEPVRSPRPVWGSQASNFPHGQSWPPYMPPRNPAAPAFPRPPYPPPPFIPRYPNAPYSPQVLPPPVPHPNNYPGPASPSAPHHPVYWYRPAVQTFRAPNSLPRPPPFVLPVPHPAFGPPFGSDSHHGSMYSAGNYAHHSNTAKNSQPRVFSSPLRRNPRRISVVKVPSENLYGTNDGLGDELPREEPTTQQSGFEENESSANVSSRQPRKLSYGDDEDNDDANSSQEGGCGADLSCRTSYHCALLGGRPTFLPCSYSPKLYCCDLNMEGSINTSRNKTVKSDPQCGWNRERTSRVIGGHNADFGEIPWQAFVRVEGFRCGGALLSRTHVVTAAHCVVGRKQSDIEVLLGELVLKRMVEELPHERRRVARVIVHPDYENLNVDSYDVAILVLDRPVEYQANIVPICLPEPDESFIGTMATVSGWGRVFADHEIRANHLQSVQVPVIGNRLCRNWLRSRKKYAGINADHICAGFEEGGRDSCRGDSGGPLTYQKNGRWYLVGIVSAGFSCGKPRQPGIYHRVSHSVEWISKKVFS